MTADLYAEYRRLRFDRPDDGVLLITIDNPGALNATDGEIHLELSRIFRTVADDESVRAVVVTGEGTARWRPKMGTSKKRLHAKRMAPLP